jgi:hypothetical protein
LRKEEYFYWIKGADEVRDYGRSDREESYLIFVASLVCVFIGLLCCESLSKLFLMVLTERCYIIHLNVSSFGWKDFLKLIHIFDRERDLFMSCMELL